MDGLGLWTPFGSPAVGQPWTATVPVGRRWRIWGGGLLLVTTAVAGRRNPFITVNDAAMVPWVGGQDDVLLGIQPAEFVPPSATRRLVLYEFRNELRQTFASTFFPVPCKAKWLEAGTVVTLNVQNLDAGDQLSQVTLLLEDVAA